MVLYISETAPSHLRGSFVSVSPKCFISVGGKLTLLPALQAFQPAVGLGGIIGGVISKALAGNPTKHSYQIQLAILYVVPVWLFIYAWFLPESPRWLAIQGRDEDSGRSLRNIRGTAADPEKVSCFDIASAELGDN